VYHWQRLEPSGLSCHSTTISSPDNITHESQKLLNPNCAVRADMPYFNAGICFIIMKRAAAQCKTHIGCYENETMHSGMGNVRVVQNVLENVNNIICKDPINLLQLTCTVHCCAKFDVLVCIV
jgi:hypothetical protein